MPPKSDPQDLALRFCRTLADDTAGRPMQYRIIGTIGVRARIRDETTLKGVVEFARDQGWLEIVDGHSVCLTDDGRKIAKV